jgi:membrane peptidoglycan carboxypeptidase
MRVNVSFSFVLTSLRRAVLVVAVSALAGVLVAGLALPIAAGLGLVARESANEFASLPADLEPTATLPERSRMTDPNGRTIGTFYEENRVYVELDDIAPIMKEAVLAIEDHRFYEHGPIDFQGTARAFMSNLEADDITGGGSTLTQQYVKVLQFQHLAQTDEERQAAIDNSYGRKLRELRMAVHVEEQLTKDEILQEYLNLVYLGGPSGRGNYGVEAAAQYYFSTSAADLELEQAALLAGIVQRPTAFDPTRNPEAALSRRNVVLTRMAELGVITQDEAVEARATDLGLDIRERPSGCAFSPEPFFCDYVVAELLQLEELGTEDELMQLLTTGGLTITTTLDRTAQRAAQDAIAETVYPEDSAAAALASVEPGTGAIKALAQSRGYGQQGDGTTFLNLAVDAHMTTGGFGSTGAQAGSTFKTYVLAAALKQGISLYTSFNSPYQVRIPENRFSTCEGTYRSTNEWAPVNYSTSVSGRHNIFTGTEQSVNTFYAQLEEQTGLCDPWRIASQTGMSRANGDPLAQVPALVLGSENVSPLAMAESYATFASRGVHCESYAIEKIRDRDGEVLYEADPECNRVLDREIADGVNLVLEGVVERGTGTRMRLADGRPAAGKTGTTNNAVAVWWVGYVPQLSTAVAVFDPDVDPNSGRLETLHGRTIGGVSNINACGGCLPGPIWKSMMDSIMGDYDRESFVRPPQSVIGSPPPPPRSNDDEDGEESGGGRPDRPGRPSPDSTNGSPGNGNNGGPPGGGDSEDSGGSDDDGQPAIPPSDGEED